MTAGHLVFAYGSLAGRAGGRVATLRGYRRAWNVAMDNSVDLPGYKHYLDPETGERPALYVAFVNLVEAAGSAVNGVAFPIAAHELPALDARERNYARREVTGRAEPAPPGARVWTYLGSEDARARYERGVALGTAVVPADYLARVRDAFAALGELDRFEASTDAPAVPVRELRRVDVDAAS